MPSPRVLIVADNASARFGGEAILPLKIFVLLARRGRDVRLITHARCRDELVAAWPDLAHRMQFSPDTRMHRLLWRLGARMPGAIRVHLFGTLMGLLTGWQQRRMASTLVREGLVDLVHQPIPVSPLAPSQMHGLGVPVVIGPMNGAMTWPLGYEDYEPRSGRVFVGLAKPLAGLANRLIPGKRRAALLLVANARTESALPVLGPRVVRIEENGVDHAIWPTDEERRAHEGPLRLAFMGRLIRLKGVDFLLQALTLTSRPVTLAILGDGEQRTALEARVAALGLDTRVTFHGFVPQQACAPILQCATALVLPSLHECGGAVVLEAMAMRLAVIVADWGGPAEYVDESVGLKVAPSPRDGFARRLAEAIDRLDADPALARTLGAAGAARVRALYDWESKIDRFEVLYSQTLDPKRQGPWS